MSKAKKVLDMTEAYLRKEDGVRINKLHTGFLTGLIKQDIIPRVSPKNKRKVNIKRIPDYFREKAYEYCESFYNECIRRSGGGLKYLNWEALGWDFYLVMRKVKNVIKVDKFAVYADYDIENVLTELAEDFIPITEEEILDLVSAIDNES